MPKLAKEEICSAVQKNIQAGMTRLAAIKAVAKMSKHAIYYIEQVAVGAGIIDPANAGHNLTEIRKVDKKMKKVFIALERLKYYTELTDKVCKNYENLDLCEACGRGGKIEDHIMLLKAAKEGREGIKDSMSIVKDYMLIFKHKEFQDEVLAILQDVIPEKRNEILRRLRTRAQTAGILDC